eukprot:COSAG01_NODE_8139_length_2908_cov_1.915628_2_plen_159_part_00
MQQLLFGTPVPGLKSKPTDKLVYYAGHDINIYFVRVLLGLSWLTESWNLNQSPPGGLLRFELSHAASGSADAKYVTLYTAMFGCVLFINAWVQVRQNLLREPVYGAATHGRATLWTARECERPKSRLCRHSWLCVAHNYATHLPLRATKDHCSVSHDS